MKKFIFVMMIFFLFCTSVYAKSGSMKLLAVAGESSPKGSMADLYLEIKEGSGRVFMDSFPLSKIDTQISTRFAKEVACNFLERDCSNYDFFYTIRANSAIIGGPSAGAAITILTISVLDDLPLDNSATITGTINTGGIIGPVGGIPQKIAAASETGLKKVLIPKYSQLNETNISSYHATYNIKIVEVSDLSEAIKEMTGKDFNSYHDVNISNSYLETMKIISEDLCKRAEAISKEITQIGPNRTGTELLKKGKNALEIKQYYSAASYCLGSGVDFRYLEITNRGLSKEQIKNKIIETIDSVNEYKNATGKRQLKTITDLETYMVVTDRLIEARDRLNDALFYIAKDNINSSIYNLGYGIERLNSGREWAEFFGKPGLTYNINKKVLDDSCLKKISEVEERIQYLELYLPSGTEDIKQAVKKSYEDYYEGNPELCLYKSSIAKAKVDSVLNTIAIDDKDIGKVIVDRLIIVKSILAKQSSRQVFPILAYSYYEYANSLKENDPYAALLYLEYSIELGNLDIYFEKKKVPLPKITNILYVSIFLSGLFIGIAVGLIITRIRRKKR